MTNTPKKICIMASVPVSINAFYGSQIDFLADNGFDVTVVTSPDPALCAKISRRCRLVAIPMARSISPLSDLRAFFRMLKVMREGSFDIVQYSSPKAALLGSLCAALCGVPVRLYLMWGLYYTGQKGFMRFLMKSVEKAVCAASTDIAPDSEGNRHFAVEEKLCPEWKIGVVGPGSAGGVDLEKFDPVRLAGTRQELRGRIGAGRDDVIFGFTGRLHRDKGINELLRAFAALRKNHPGVRLLLVGPDESGKGLEPDVRRLLKEKDGIHLTGFQERPEEWMACMDVFVLPSYREGFGLVNIEASALGIPVISTDIPGPRDSVARDTSGLLVAVACEKALGEAMERLLSDTQLRLRLGQGGRAWARRFELGRMRQTILAHRRGLIEAHPRSRPVFFLYPFTKRLFDLCAALTLLVLLSPVFLLTALTVFITMGAPVFFVQQRPGYKGRPFGLIKFRTMRSATGPSGGQLPDAARLTAAGKLLRRLSLDELPELVNVLQGEMSLVGPRPLLMKYLPLYSAEQKRRHDVRPGLTGWAQVNGRNALSWEDKFRLDVWYVDHRGLLLDLAIATLTFRTLARGTGITQPGSATAEEFKGRRP